MLHYSKHGECILQEIGAAFRGEHPSDLLLVCEGRETLKAHKLVLAAASPFIRYVQDLLFFPVQCFQKMFIDENSIRSENFFYKCKKLHVQYAHRIQLCSPFYLGLLWIVLRLFN